MNQQSALRPAQAPAPTVRRDLVALGAVALAYAIIFWATREQGWGATLVQVARSVLPLAIVAALARAALIRWILPRDGWRAWIGHALLATAFTLGWLWLLTVAAGLFDGRSPTRFQVAPFLLGPAAAWQLLQGLAFYVALAAVTALDTRPPAAGLVIIDDRSALPDRFLIKAGEDIGPVLASEIVSVLGADDYTEVNTTGGTHLVSTTLAEWEGSLDPRRFLRAHRSAIVNLDRMLRAEPAGGGRMILRLEAGPDVTASRAGAKLLRERLA